MEKKQKLKPKLGFKIVTVQNLVETDNGYTEIVFEEKYEELTAEEKESAAKAVEKKQVSVKTIQKPIVHNLVAQKEPTKTQ